MVDPKPLTLDPKPLSLPNLTSLPLSVDAGPTLTPTSIKFIRFLKLVFLERKPLLACFGFVKSPKWLVSTKIKLRKRLNLIDVGVKTEPAHRRFDQADNLAKHLDKDPRRARIYHEHRLWYHSTLGSRVIKKKNNTRPRVLHARLFVGASQRRSWSHLVVL